MAGLLGGADATAQLALAGASAGSGKLEEPDHSSANWYFSRDEIEKQSPSRLDGIDIKKETYFRKSYCTFLQDLGMRLKVYDLEPGVSLLSSGCWHLDIQDLCSVYFRLFLGCVSSPTS